MSPAERGQAGAGAGGPGASALPLVVLVFFLILAGLIFVQARIAGPDAKRYHEWVSAGAGHGGSEQLVSLPPTLDKLVQTNRMPGPGGPPDDATTEFLESMSARATRAHLSLKSIVPGDRDVTPVRVKIQARLKLTGTYPALLQLLDDMSRAGELLSVDYLHVKRDNEHGQGLLIDLWVSRVWINPEVSA